MCSNYWAVLLTKLHPAMLHRIPILVEAVIIHVLIVLMARFVIKIQFRTEETLRQLLPINSGSKLRRRCPPMAEKLTEQQKQAVEDRGGQLLVSAAAGSGKTKVLVDRLRSYISR